MLTQAQKYGVRVGHQNALQGTDLFREWNSELRPCFGRAGAGGRERDGEKEERVATSLRKDIPLLEQWPLA